MKFINIYSKVLILFLTFSNLIHSSESLKDFKNFESYNFEINSVQLRRKVDTLFNILHEDTERYFLIPTSEDEYEDNARRGENFDVSCLNYCTAGIQWLLKDSDDKIHLTSFEFLKSQTNRILVFINSQTYQWHQIEIENQDERFQLVTWPYRVKSHKGTYLPIGI